MNDCAPIATDTIVGIATPAGRGGIGVVRLSGPHAMGIATVVAGTLPAPRQAALRRFRDAEGCVIDQGLVLRFSAPSSFTGEDVVELHAHGGPVLLALLLEALTRAGARQARAGEFSERAFLNGRIDLAQAEAIADLIEAGSEAAVKAARRTLHGDLSREVNAIAELLDELRVWTEAAIDFPEEEIDFLADPALAERLASVCQRLASLRRRARSGVLLRDGVQLVLAGRPNVGKSTLLNALVGEQAAIVTDVPGTTRDPVRVRTTVGGVVFELVDTAGLRESADVVERIGIERAREAVRAAELLLLVMEDDDAWREDELSIAHASDVPVIPVRNKTDRSGGSAGARACRQVENTTEVGVWARSGAGLDALRDAMLTAVQGESCSTEHSFSARQRHLQSLDETQAALEAASQVLRESRAGELLAEELRTARGALGAIVGEQSSDELLGRIFASFCIGK